MPRRPRLPGAGERSAGDGAGRRAALFGPRGLTASRRRPARIRRPRKREAIRSAQAAANGDDNFNTLTANGTDSLRTEIFNTMVGSTETFAFTDIGQATSHFSTRVEVVNAMNQMDASNGPIRFGVAPKGGIQYADLWRSTASPREPKTISLKRVSNRVSSTAVTNIENQTTMTDCITGAKAAVLIGFRRARGNDWFDAQFPSDKSLILDQSDPSNMSVMVAASDANTNVPGDLRYMPNFRPVLYAAQAKKRGKSPVWSGEACIYVGGGNYTGIGQKNVTEAELRATLAQAWTDDAGSTLAPVDIATIKFTWQDRVKILP